uniref:Ionotropic glutamate receptor C-terminal domain-containing protein n=1 Tax=Musca domestica TaxID=7370 RepID=A0A1I8M3J3_MUSDO
MNGFVAKFIILFARTHNATLEMPLPLEVGKETHFTIINQMVADNKLDLPMAMIPGMYASEWRDVSDTYDLNQIILMVPLSHKLSMQEIFGLLLNGHFFCCFFVSSLVLSFCHGFIDHWRQEWQQFWDWIITERVWPGLLGQSFHVRRQPLASLKIIYLVIGFSGLYIATRFSANMNMYLNKPPYHPQIRNYHDLRESKMKILVDVADSRDSEDLREFIVYTSNTTYLHENRRKLNTSFCYYATTATYQVLLRQQRYSSHHVFHTPKSMAYFSMLPWGFRLQHNSPYKEALNEFIHNVHSAGLIHAWHNSLFWDMLKLKKVSIRYRPVDTDQRVLTASDLYWVWMIIPTGLGGSCVVFFLEVLWVRKKVFKRKISLPQ